jgi:DNA polymerase I-like protein with 3'-5' exonuclease and polymerase domains
MGLKGRKVRGKYSTEASVLEELRGVPIIDYILEYRQLMKLKSTYIDALPCLVNSRTGRDIPVSTRPAPPRDGFRPASRIYRTSR